MNPFPIQIHGLYTAPEHRVFGIKEGNVSGEDLLSHKEANLIADAGIEGDRFCKHRPDYNGHITFFSREVWDEVSKELKLPQTAGPQLARRNVVVSGVDLKALYGQPFEINCIQFEGTVHCAPCPAMNRSICEGATKVLRGRGGLRAQVKSDGVLKCGPSELIAPVEMNPQLAATSGQHPKLP